MCDSAYRWRTFKMLKYFEVILNISVLLNSPENLSNLDSQIRFMNCPIIYFEQKTKRSKRQVLLFVFYKFYEKKQNKAKDLLTKYHLYNIATIIIFLYRNETNQIISFALLSRNTVWGRKWS